jgi:hypothetical protein
MLTVVSALHEAAERVRVLEARLRDARRFRDADIRSAASSMTERDIAAETRLSPAMVHKILNQKKKK